MPGPSLVAQRIKHISSSKKEAGGSLLYYIDSFPQNGRKGLPALRMWGVELVFLPTTTLQEQTTPKAYNKSVFLAHDMSFICHLHICLSSSLWGSKEQSSLCLECHYVSWQRERECAGTNTISSNCCPKETGPLSIHRQWPKQVTGQVWHQRAKERKCFLPPQERAAISRTIIWSPIFPYTEIRGDLAGQEQDGISKFCCDKESRTALRYRQKAGDLPWNCLLLYEQLVCRSWATDW